MNSTKNVFSLLSEKSVAIHCEIKILEKRNLCSFRPGTFVAFPEPMPIWCFGFNLKYVYVLGLYTFLHGSEIIEQFIAHFNHSNGDQSIRKKNGL